MEVRKCPGFCGSCMFVSLYLIVDAAEMVLEGTNKYYYYCYYY